MEILVPGLLLVALMVYVSTKIKKKAAIAYEREIIHNDEFSIIKPEGFISPADGGEAAFAAYSMEFGSGSGENVRRASAKVRLYRGERLESVVHRILGASEDSGDSGAAKPIDNKARIIEREEVVDGCTVAAIYKLIDGGAVGTFELAILILPDYRGEYLPKIDEMLNTFKVN